MLPNGVRGSFSPIVARFCLLGASISLAPTMLISVILTTTWCNAAERPMVDLVVLVDSRYNVNRVRLIPQVDDIKEVRVFANAWIQPLEHNPWLGFVLDGRDSGTYFWRGEWTGEHPRWTFRGYALMTSGDVLLAECGRWSREPCHAGILITVGLEKRTWGAIKQLWR